VTDDLVKRPDDEQDDLTLVYMWAYKMAEKKYKSRIEQLEAALREIAEHYISGVIPDDYTMAEWAVNNYGHVRNIARSALGEKKDG
jgi:hypothetical protein